MEDSSIYPSSLEKNLAHNVDSVFLLFLYLRYVWMDRYVSSRKDGRKDRKVNDKINMYFLEIIIIKIMLKKLSH